MKFNLDYYQNGNEKVSKIEEEIIQTYIKQKEENEEDILKKDNRLEVVEALSEIRKNIINWYPFISNATILEIGGNLGEITQELCQKARRVVTIEENKIKAEAIAKRHQDKENLEVIAGKIQDIPQKENFDYVVINGKLEYAPFMIKSEQPFTEFLKIAVGYLKEDGKLLIATDNKFGIRYWNGKKDLDGTYEYRNLGTRRNQTQPQLFTKKSLEEMLTKVNIPYRKFYYIFPDYKMPNLIYSEEYEISKEDISRNFTCYQENELVSFVENDVLRELMKEDSKLINFYANSFFIEASKKEIETDIKYVSYTNYRKKEYQIMTKLKKDTVEKKAVSPKAQKHIDNMKQHIEKLKLYHIKTLEKSQRDYLQSEFIKNAKRYDVFIDECHQIDEALKAMTPYIEKLYENAITYDQIHKEELKNTLKECDENILKKFKYLEYGFMDFIPKNIFYKDGELYAFDQEWMEKYIPVEHILYRAIINSNLYTRFSDEILKRLNLIENRELFNKIEGEFGAKVIDTTILEKVFRRKTKNRNDLLKEIEEQKEQRNKQKAEYTMQIQKLTQENEVQKEIIQKNNEKIREDEQKIANLNQELNAMVNSKSWKITKPLREVTKYLSNGGNK